jgi:hypothetical protein
MTLLDWIFRSLSVLLALLACGAVVLGLWGDRLRGRTRHRRCPRCWYDLSGATANNAQAWLCTECGHLEAAEAGLHRGRRRGWLIAASVPIAMLALLAWIWPTIDRDGWRATVPTWVIVKLWPIDEVAWMEGRGARAPMVAELDRRVDYNKASGAMLAAWAQRVEASYRVLGRGLEAPGVGMTAPGASSSRNTPVMLRVDLTRTFENLASADDRSRSSWQRCLTGGWRDPIPSAAIDSAVWPWVSDTQESIANQLMWMVRPDSWLAHGGNDATFRWSGTSLLVLGPPEMLVEAKQLLHGLEKVAGLAYADHARGARVVMLDAAESQVVVRDIADIQIGPVPADSSLLERVDSVRARLVADLDPESWTDNGGDVGMIQSVGALLVVRHTPQVQARIDEYLGTLRQAQAP